MGKEPERQEDEANSIDPHYFVKVIKSQCPLIKDPLDHCYCINMNSQKIEAAIYYCGGNFSDCEIYRNNLK